MKCIYIEFVRSHKLYKSYKFYVKGKEKANQSHYRLEVPRGFQEVKVPRLRDNGRGWW